jgi:hypothetical protein
MYLHRHIRLTISIGTSQNTGKSQPVQISDHDTYVTKVVPLSWPGSPEPTVPSPMPVRNGGATQTPWPSETSYWWGTAGATSADSCWCMESTAPQYYERSTHRSPART